MNPYLKLAVETRSLAEDRPPEVTAPLVRRVLGKALIDLFCPFGKPHCQERQGGGARVPPTELCHLAESCPYGVLFAASRTGRPPYAVHVPIDRDDKDLIEVALFGPACSFYPWLLRAFQLALRSGLGKARRRYDVHAIYRAHEASKQVKICSADLTQLPPTLEPGSLELSMDQDPERQMPVEVHLLSPTRLIHDGKLLPGHRPVPFDLLVARILDRFRGLYGDAASEILRPEIRRTVEAEAARVPLISDETKWVEVKDYSARGRSELLLGGKVGRLVYGAEAARFLPILKAGEILHVGKNPASGCGRLSIVMPEVAM